MIFFPSSSAKRHQPKVDCRHVSPTAESDSGIPGIIRNSSNFTVLEVYFQCFCVFFFKFTVMPKVKRSRKPPPEGWELIEPTLDELDQKMREGTCNFTH